MEHRTTDGAILNYQQQVEHAAGEYHYVERECAALLERTDTQGVFSVGRDEIIIMIQTYGATSRNYHAALMRLIKYVGCEGDNNERIAQCQQLLHRLHVLEQQFNRRLLSLDNLVIEWKRFVEQTTPRVEGIRYVRTGSFPKHTAQFVDRTHARHLPTD